MKKIIVSTIIIVAFVLYGVLHSKTTTALPVISSSSSGSTNNPSPSSSPAPTTSSSLYKDGTYTGSAANAFYGNIQVQATISGGKLTNVIFLQYPSGENHSMRINQQADPILAQEAIQAQNAQVDTVSGATDTSQAFVQSLTSALDQAKS